jgi:uncharacterized protein
MRNKKLPDRIFRFFKFIYIKLFRIHDTPQRIALGFGLGVFTGILPGAGPIAAIFLALLFHANRASALLGSLITNTWLSVLTFSLSVRIGLGIMGLTGLWRIRIIRIVGTLITGYLAVALCAGALTYFIALVIAKQIKHENKN